MFRPQRRGVSLGLLLLAHQLYSVGLDTLPPVTLVAVVGQILLFMGIVNPPWDSHAVCLSGEVILVRKHYSCLFLSAIEHVDDIHLYHNMVSLIFKGKSLEKRYGSPKFLILLLVFTLATSLTYVGLAWLATEVLESYSYMRQCAIGFSGVLFALKVLTTHYEGGAFHYIHGMRVPSKYAVWVELLIIHILVPQASFIGHLAGILVGLAYIFGPLKHIVDMIHGTIDGNAGVYGHRPSYTYTRSTVGSQPQQESSSHSSQQYGWSVGGQNQQASFQQGSSTTYQPTMEEIRQERLRRFQN